MKKSVLHPRTALINAIQKKESKKTRNQALEWLEKTFPEAFDNKKRIRPLKIGILQDILAQAQSSTLSKSKLREAVVVFTRRLDYLVCLKTREMRIDLQGQACGQVTEEEAAAAALKIKKRVENHSKHAKKLVAETIGKSEFTKPATTVVSPADTFPVYPLRSIATETKPSPPKATTVVVKQKAARVYDPEAVARLKEKLGLSGAER